MFRRVIATFAALLTAAAFAATAQAAEPVLSEDAPLASFIAGVQYRDLGASFWAYDIKEVLAGRYGTPFNGNTWGEFAAGDVQWPSTFMGTTQIPIRVTYGGGKLSTEVGDGVRKTTTTATTGDLGPLNYIRIRIHNPTSGTIGLKNITLDDGPNLGHIVETNGSDYWKITGKDVAQGFNLTGDLELSGGLTGIFTYLQFDLAYLPPTDEGGPVTSNVQVDPKVAVLKGAIDLKAEMSDPSKIAYAQFCTKPLLDQQRCLDSGWEMIGAADGAFGGSKEVVYNKLFKAAEAVGVHEACVRGIDTFGKVGDAVCQPYAVAYKFDGFFQPISNVQVNFPRAGRAFPVKWRLTDANGQPIDDPDSIKVVTYPVNCSDFTGEPNAVEETVAAGNSGLQFLGDGYWQYNWKTQNEDAGTCHRLLVQLKDGVGLPSARFKFRQ